jgi:hypothetical protein
MNITSILAFVLQYMPGILSWLVAEGPTIIQILSTAQALSTDLQTKGMSAETANTKAGAVAVAQIAAHIASLPPTVAVAVAK